MTVARLGLLLLSLLAIPIRPPALAQESSSRSAADRGQIEAAARLAASASELYRKGQFREAIAASEEALMIHRKILGNTHADTAMALDALADLYRAQREYAKAEPVYQEALAIRNQLNGDAHPDTARSLHNLGLLYRAQGAYRRAEQFLERALTIRRDIYGEDHPETATSLMSLGSIYVERGDYARAEPLYEQALETRRRRDEGNDVLLENLNNLGFVFHQQGDYTRAETLYREALAIRPSVTILNNLGTVYSNRGDYAGAEPLFQQALALARKIRGEFHPDTAASLNHLGLLHSRGGDFPNAERELQQALTIRQKVLGEAHFETSVSLNNLALLYDNQGADARAEQLFQQTLAIRRRALGDQNPYTANILANLGRHYRVRGDYTRAEPLLQEALSIRRRVHGEMHRMTSISIGQLGLLYAYQGDYTRAEPLLQQALAIRREALGETHPETAAGLTGLGLLYHAMGDDARAEPLYQQALVLTHAHVDSVSVAQSERQQLAMMASLRYNLDGYLSLAARRSEFAARAWAHTLAWKGGVLARQRAYRAVGQQADLQDTFRELQATASRLGTLAYQEPEPSEAERWREQVRELSARKEKLEADLARRSADYRRLLQPPTADDVRQALPKGTVLLDFLEYQHSDSPGSTERRLAAFVVAPQGDPRLIVLGAVKPFVEAIEVWRAAHGSGVEAMAAGRRLRESIWVPLEAVFRDYQPTQVLVSPDGILGSLPWAALPGRGDGTFLLEDWAIATVPAPQLLPEQLRQPSRLASRGNVLIVGNVNHDARNSVAAPLRPFPTHRAPRQEQAPFARLLGTLGELATIQQLYRDAFGPDGLQVVTDTAASEEVLRREAPHYRYLHLATHGFFAAPRFQSALSRSVAPPGIDDPASFQGLTGYHPGLLSGLALAGANAPTADEDGILTAEEVTTLDLSAVSLAVLSACETGLGQVAGGEGLLGLQRAFHAAGARSVIATLWKVDDGAARDLIERFYENLWNKNLNKLEALRDAQLWMLRSRGTRDLTPVDKQDGNKRLPPYYWAAFVLSGDWR